ncbi:hypothetical protein [Mucilaginibacter celer]|uniref:Outer membrane protein beta-barrel domain-containing protein n=1 Tax=Mucilaginibacter celer TaxID=2305508 RepID=A0A494VYV6_9SPHI|nr:hypothetical protein [Mucilaginibacter celer]AYL96498.1 hypothetical protein HYN43_014845 [Mucilaginibacter celer]
MKLLSKLTAAVLVMGALFFANTAKAQTTPANAFRLGLGIETGVPTGLARLGSTFTLGGTARLQYGISNDFAATFTVGGYHFFPKKIPGSDKRYGSYGEIPIKFGFKEFFVPNVYFGGEAGIAYEKLEEGWGPHRLDLSPGLGYANKTWDVSIRYENFSGADQPRFGMVGLRLAYGFGL